MAIWICSGNKEDYRRIPKWGVKMTQSWYISHAKKFRYFFTCENIIFIHITKTRLFKYIENLTSKTWKFSDNKTVIFFHISAQNIDCGYSLEPPRRGGSNEYPQSMFLGRNKKNNVYPCKPQFYYIKFGFKGGQIYIGMFSWWFRMYIDFTACNEING